MNRQEFRPYFWSSVSGTWKAYSSTPLAVGEVIPEGALIDCLKEGLQLTRRAGCDVFDGAFFALLDPQPYLPCSDPSKLPLSPNGKPFGEDSKWELIDPDEGLFDDYGWNGKSWVKIDSRNYHLVPASRFVCRKRPVEAAEAAPPPEEPRLAEYRIYDKGFLLNPDKGSVLCELLPGVVPIIATACSILHKDLWAHGIEPDETLLVIRISQREGEKG